MTTAEAGVARTKPCRDCRREISLDAYACPHCGAPHPARETWDGRGFEYKSRLAIAGWPLLHISFKYRNRRPVVARGVIAIGQFACGLVCISQFGIGLVSVSQFTIAGYALAQFGLYVAQGSGQHVMRVSELLARLGAFWQ